MLEFFQGINWIIYFQDFLEPVELLVLGTMLLYPWVVKQLVVHQVIMINIPPLWQLPLARCAARSCDGMVLIVGHFNLFSSMLETRWGWRSLLHLNYEIFLIKK